jgi:hypothetical protein
MFWQRANQMIQSFVSFAESLPDQLSDLAAAVICTRRLVPDFSAALTDHCTVLPAFSSCVFDHKSTL